MTKKFVLGISAFYHDSAAALTCNDELVAAAQEERFTRIKNDEGFPVHAIRYCLQEAGIELADLSAVVFYEKPFLKFERIIETFYRTAPFAPALFLRAIPVWLKGKLFLKKTIRDGLAGIAGTTSARYEILFTEHHLSHAASAFYPSPFNEAAILTVDGVGEWATCTISHGKGNSIELLRQLNFPQSIGLFYSAVTYYCGFKVNRDEYKLMGLAAYGNEEGEQYQRVAGLIEKNLVAVADDGSVLLNQRYFRYRSAMKMVNGKGWKELFGMGRREKEEELAGFHCDLALATQRLVEKVMLRLAAEALRLTGSPNLCLAGGVALNGVANGRLTESGLFKNIFFQPAASDAGGSVGAALAGYHIFYNGERINRAGSGDGMKGGLLGPAYDEPAVRRACSDPALEYDVFEDASQFHSEISRLLAAGNIVGWFQGRMEFGPRALGNRSILADPRPSSMQAELNEKTKFRENFRPFAPVILESEAAGYFDIPQPSPYMLQVHSLKTPYRKALPPDWNQLGIRDKLAFRRSDFPAITHVDFSARVQTITEESNPGLYALLSQFYHDTGCPMLVNTSFNTDNEPIVNSPADAVRCFLRSKIDYLAIHNFLVKKKQS